MQDRNNNNGQQQIENRPDFPKVNYRKIDEFMSELEPLRQLTNIDGTKTYSVGTTLGKGGFAKVFLAREEDHISLRKRTVAIKIVPKKRLQREDQKEKILREIDIQYECEHENIVKMFSSWQDSKMYCMVLEFCETGSVSNFQKKFPKSRIPELEAVTIGRQVLAALSYLHNRLIIHRDVKMGNILITNGTAKLADFGLCLEYMVTPQNSICGTPNFLAPEVFTTKQHEPASDIWAFGCVLYSMLCGYAPFRFTNMQETGRLIMDIRYTLPHYLSPEAVECIEQILVKKPADRATPGRILELALFTKYTMPREFGPGNKRQLMKSSEDSGSMKATTSKKLRPAGKPAIVKAPKKPMRPVQVRKRRGQVGGIRRSMEGLKLDSRSLEDHREPVYVTKWVDNFKHTGFGYTLSNGTQGVFLKDGGTLLETDRLRRFIDQNGHAHAADDPKVFKRPIRFLEEFKSYMQSRLVPGCSQESTNQANSGRMDVRVKEFVRSDNSILMRLSTGVYQMNILAGVNKGIKVVITRGGFLSINKMREKKFYGWSEITGLLLTQVNLKPPALVEVLQYAHDEITHHDKEFMSGNFDRHHKLCKFLDCGGHMIQ